MGWGEETMGHRFFNDASRAARRAKLEQRKWQKVKPAVIPGTSRLPTLLSLKEFHCPSCNQTLLINKMNIAKAGTEIIYEPEVVIAPLQQPHLQQRHHTVCTGCPGCTPRQPTPSEIKGALKELRKWTK